MSEHRYHFSRLSGNRKLGGLPATSSSRSTCPDNCSLKKNGCYGENMPMSHHWNRMEHKGITLEQLCEKLKDLPKFQLYRMWQVGDFPGNGGVIDFDSAAKLVKANKGRHGFAFSHYDPRLPENAAFFQHANDNGLTVNLSAESLVEADTYADLNVGPVVTLLPYNSPNTKTPAGRDVTLCPATVNDRMTCAKCGICAVPQRQAIVGFRSHGSRTKAVESVFWAKSA